jgi:hypothetical protein
MTQIHDVLNMLLLLTGIFAFLAHRQHRHKPTMLLSLE